MYALWASCLKWWTGWEKETWTKRGTTPKEKLKFLKLKIVRWEREREFVTLQCPQLSKCEVKKFLLKSFMSTNICRLCITFGSWCSTKYWKQTNEKKRKEKNMSYFERIQKIIATTTSSSSSIADQQRKRSGFSECWVGILYVHFKTLVGTSIKSLWKNFISAWYWYGTFFSKFQY